MTSPVAEAELQTDAARRAPKRAGPPLPLWQIVAAHVVFMAMYTIVYVNALWVVPLLVRLKFGSADPNIRDWQTTLITAAIPTFMIFSIFWNALLARLPLRRYAFVYWTVSVLPLACLALVQNYWQLLLCHVAATAGQGSWTPLNGKLLKHLYPDRLRGRVYGVLNAASLIAAIISVWALGRWLESRPDAFRVYFPVTAGIQFAGLFLLVWLGRRTGMPDERVEGTGGFWKRVVGPVTHMGAVLRADRTFARYETAFMTYGAAYMMCDALLPIYATVKLHMGYEDYAHSTQMILRLVMLLSTLPMGWIHDRIGPVRTSCLAFAVLIGYPLLVWHAGDFWGLSVASVVYGLGLAAVGMGWMLGPVVLAKTPERVPQYVAIHATLVGFRGVIFQGLGTLLYKLTGSFVGPFVLASLLFTHATWQMWRLHVVMRGGGEQPVEFTAE